MNNIDDWLNSLGISDPMHDSVTTLTNAPVREIERAIQEHEETNSHPVDNLPIVPEPQQPQEVFSNNPISPDDLNDILTDNGFQEPEYEEAEEVEDEEGGEVEEVNTEEDYLYMQQEGYTTAEWATMSIEERRQAVENAIRDDERDLDAEEDADWDRLEEAGVITPVNDFNLHTSEEAIQAVQDVNENYPAHNPDEEVSQDAMEAFGLAEQPEHPTVEPLLAPNSSTLLINDATSRFSGTEWYESIQHAKIILAGLGGIGRT